MSDVTVQVPSMARQELWHPISVHAPIALLVVGGLLFAAMWLPPCRRFRSPLLFAARVNLVVGALGAWAAVYTGHLADAVVARTLCDPLVLESHEQGGTLLAWLFSGVAVLDLASLRLPRWRTAIHALLTVAVLAGIPLVGYVGHLGGKLVYQQAAAVYHPSEDCSEFLPEPP